MEERRGAIIFDDPLLCDPCYFPGSLYRTLSQKEIEKLDRYAANPKLSLATRVNVALYRLRKRFGFSE
jgi:hypothetical protein